VIGNDNLRKGFKGKVLKENYVFLYRKGFKGKLRFPLKN